MHSAQNHIVAQYRLELDFQDRRDAHVVADELLAASRNQVAALIDECCSALVHPDEYITIPRVEIDLGRLDLRNITGDFWVKFRAALHHHLQVAIAQQGQPRPEERAMDLLRNYGETGQYPWWAGSPAPALLQAAFTTVIQSPDPPVVRRLRDLLGRGQTLRRLVLALPEQQLVQLWQVMAALQGPRMAQATIEAATQAVLQQATQVNRNQWLEFVYTSVLRTLTHERDGMQGQNMLLWLDSQGEALLPASLTRRFSQHDDFVAVSQWLREVMGMPAPAMVDLLLGLEKVVSENRKIDEANPLRRIDKVKGAPLAIGSGGANARSLDASRIPVAYAWLRTTWKLGTAAIDKLMAGILTAYKLGMTHGEAVQLSSESLPPEVIFLLRRDLEMPLAAPQVLVMALLIRFQAENPSSSVSISALESWLRSRFALTAENYTQLANAMEAAASSRPSAELNPILEHLGEGREEDSLSAEEAALIAQRTSAAAGQETPAGPDSNLRLQGLLPRICNILDMPEATASAVIATLLARFQNENPAANFSIPALESWLHAAFGLRGEAAAILAQEISSAAHPQSRSHQPKTAGNPPSTLPLTNAGLVLFWPFLQRFFQYQGLVEDKGFVSPVAQEQAVRLLQSMVDPETEWNEAALVLPKLLCGLSPDAIVDPHIDVQVGAGHAFETSHDVGAGHALPLQDIHDALIEVVLAHWPMAGKLTPDGFRQAWLQRNGTLRIRDDHWLLRVETLAHDILLEGLPWEIAYITLPWMPHMMYVDWGEKAKFNA